MTLRTVRSRAAEPMRGHDISQLAVMVRFGALVVAVAAPRVARIVIAEEVVPAGGATPWVRIGDATLPAWDLGVLLGLAGAPAAWLVMTTGDEPDAPRIALGTGPCVAVASHDGVSPLPAGVVTAAAAGIVGVFVTDPALRERGVGQLGVRVDPLQLIGPAGLAAARRGAR